MKTRIERGRLIVAEWLFLVVSCWKFWSIVGQFKVYTSHQCVNSLIPTPGGQEEKYIGVITNVYELWKILKNFTE